MPRSPFRVVLVLLLPAACVLLSACVRYRPACVDAPRAALRFGALAPGPLSFDDAVRHLVERNPDLARLRFEAMAVNPRPGPGPLVGSMEIPDGRVGETMIGTDVLSLLGIGPRRAEIALARAMRDARWMRHHERARDLVAQLAEAYAVERVLRDLGAPEPVLDVAAFRTAGLASASDLAAAEAVRAEAEAEGAVIRAELADVRREIARLAGADPASVVEPVPTAEDWPPVPAPDDRALLFARGDLQRLRGAFAVADQRFRLGVARQWPNLFVGVGGNVDLETPMQMIRIDVPLDAPAEARALSMAREAARAAYEAGVLDALHEAASSRLTLDAASARLRGAAARRRAAAALGRAAQARIAAAAEDAAFGAAVLAGLEEVRAAIRWREAAVARARARVRAAARAGWPTAAEVPSP